jgi:uncharacterized protein YdeI (YjbR/CyaY-like superfamily)
VIQTDADAFFVDGCGRCDDYATSACKVRTFAEPLAALRELLRSTELHEAMKWGSPCYTLDDDDGPKVCMLSTLRSGAVVGFFQGVLLSDPDGLLVAPGPNTQAARQLRFTTVEEVDAHRDALLRFVAQAIELRRSGAEVPMREAPEPVPDELQALLDSDATLAESWEALTPGRRRSFVLHVGSAKQSKTRVARAERCIPKIRAGKGFHDR